MVAVKAIYHALDLLDRPLLAGAMQEQPLPPDTLTVLKIVAGDEDAIASAVGTTAKSPRRIRQASELYIQRILFAPTANHYRVLGAARDAPQEELRERLSWLMRWQHPDRTKSEWESAFVTRVLAAWDALKTPERRRRYDATLPTAVVPPRARRPKLQRPQRRAPWISSRPARSRHGGRRRVGLIALGVAVAFAALLVPGSTVTPPQTAPESGQTDVASPPNNGNTPLQPLSGGT